ncbi:sialate O-acetylesterase, partial [Candidatus Desantisbacteria bacterium CG_4_10_14_0_8_um_filter_48_22]
WYQGESNAGEARKYQKLFPAMIRDWRSRWNQGDFGFMFVQLANFMAVQKRPSEGGWAELREAQLMTLSVPKTGMAVITDIGDEKDIHPKNKQDVGKRLALAALGTVYDKKIVYYGPIYDSMKVEGSKIRLSFKHAGTGLAVKEGEELKGFAICGENKSFKWANVQIDGNTVLAWNDEIEIPVAIRYGWANNPIGNLYNKEGLPATPFRTDAPN